MKKAKLTVQTQPSTFNTGGLSIDISDGSKDNSSHNTPNFASPKSANTQTNLDQAFKINDSDLELVPLKFNNKKASQVSNLYFVMKSIEQEPARRNMYTGWWLPKTYRSSYRRSSYKDYGDSWNRKTS